MARFPFCVGAAVKKNSAIGPSVGVENSGYPSSNGMELSNMRSQRVLQTSSLHQHRGGIPS